MLEIGARIGHYEVLKPLDKGGMGRVYLVRHTTLDAEFAMKVLNPEVAENQEYVIRFLREGRLASKIHHPNLITVHDAGQDPATGLNYLIMDYVPGGTLAELLKREKTLPPERALSIVRQVARALAAAAEHGMVHRDIKPANIMFDRDGTVRLADLGIAKGGDDMTAVTCAESVFGTPAYMSPEQAVDSGKVDGRTDIYSLGVVLWQMLTGERPYADKTAVAIVAALLSPAPLRDVRKLSPQTPKAIAKLVSDMCQKDAAQRIPSAKALLKRLDGMLDDADDATSMTVAFTTPAATAATVSTRRQSIFVRPVAWVAAGGALVVMAIVAVVAATSSKPPCLEVRTSDVVSKTIAVPCVVTNAITATPTATNAAIGMAVSTRPSAESEHLAQMRAEAVRIERDRKRLEEERAAEDRRRAEAERTARERDRVDAERKRLDAEAMLAASAMSGCRTEAKSRAKKSEPPKVAVGAAVCPKRDPAALALAAFAAGNWSLGYQYALQDATGNADVELWLGRCFDPAVKMPGFERHKKDSDLARKHYRLSAEKGNAEARRALRGL